MLVSTPSVYIPVIFMLVCRKMITAIGKPELYAWAACFALQVGLMGLLILRRNYVAFPWFTAYLAGSLAHNIAQFFIYRHWGFDSPAARWAAWGVRPVIEVLRFMAVLEICRQVFANYRGIWAFIWRTMIVCVGLTAILAMILSRRAFKYGILYADRSVGLSEAVAIVALLVFARYYRVQTEDPLRWLAIGFFLYACFVVVNDTLLEVSVKVYSPAWNLLGTAAYTSSVLVWGWALRRSVRQPAMAPEMLPASVYNTVSPDVNQRLRALNDRLSALSKRRERKP
jgi:hypothetical protein